MAADSNTSQPPAPQATSQLENIRVAVRLRPFTERERQKASKRIVDIEQNTVAIYSPRQLDEPPKKFTFDYSYWSHDGFRRAQDGVNKPDEAHPNCAKYVGQTKVFDDLGVFLLENALKGYNSALLAYGQTGSGKSYTVSGYGQNEGILPRFARQLFAELNKIAPPDEAASDEQTSSSGEKPSEELSAGPRESNKRAKRNRYEVHFSMIEIYNEVVRDLLAKSNASLVSQAHLARRGLKVREHPKRGFFVEELSSYACANEDELERRIEEGQLNKSIAATSMNETSSRGHTIYEFRIRQYKYKAAQWSGGGGGGGDSGAREDCRQEETLVTSVVQLVDLAGSERMAVHVGAGNAPGGYNVAGDTFIGSRSSSPFVRADAEPPPAAAAPQIGRKTSTTAEAAKRRSRSTRVAQTSASSGGSSATIAAGGQSAAAAQAANRRQAPPAGRGNSSSLLLAKNNLHNQRFKESVSINQSLSALGNCIQVLSQYSQQQQVPAGSKLAPKIPYRDSVLTKLLNRCCLSGNSKVVIIATLSPADANYDDTLSTLRFADRAKQIKTHATVNRMSRREMVTALQRENARLKQMVESQVGGASGAATTKSDDSSQTSNFDDSENVVDNFNGPAGDEGVSAAAAARGASRKHVAGGQADAGNRSRKLRAPVASKNRATSKSRQEQQLHRLAAGNLAAANAEQQMARLVSPAAAKTTTPKSLVAAAAGQDDDADQEISAEDLGAPTRRRLASRELLDADLTSSGLLDEIDLNDLGDIGDELLSPDSDDSFAALAEEGLSNEEKISILNKLLSNSNVANKIRKQYERQNGSSGPGRSQLARPKRTTPTTTSQQVGGGPNNEPSNLNKAVAISSSLKQTNPYLSNLNPDEQLTGVITYIIRRGEMVVGKNTDCDIVLYGPEIGGRHAKLTRETDGQSRESVFIEPIQTNGLESRGASEQAAKQIALLVNGVPVRERTQLHHCDRLLFGSNAYFVFADVGSATGESAREQVGATATLANLDMVTYDMAQREVLRKIMSEATNEAVLKEINDYTHRPGTGKHKRPATGKGPKLAGEPTRAPSAKMRPVSRLARSLSVHDDDAAAADATGPAETSSARSEPAPAATEASQADRPSGARAERERGDDEKYRDQLMADTYEFAMPVAQANAIAKEMGIKVTYGLKILPGEEQLLEGAPLCESETPTDSLSSSSDATTANSQQPSPPTNAKGSQRPQQQFAEAPAKQHKRTKRELTISSRSVKPSSLDVPPALYVHVKLDELRLDFYWPKEKFSERHYKMLELYGAFDVGGKSGLVEYMIEQSKHDGGAMYDPFVDEPYATDVLIGHAQVALGPLAHLSNLDETFEILDVDDEIAGSLSVRVAPCHEDEHTNSFRAFEQRDLVTSFVENSDELLGKRLAFEITIDSCSGIAERYVEVYCQYTLNRDDEPTRTKVCRRRRDPTPANERQKSQPPETQSDGPVLHFEHSHFVSIDRVDEEILEFLEHGFLAIQLVGQYSQPAAGDAQRQPTSGSSASGSSGAVSAPSATLISTIISSIQKYKLRLLQQQQQGAEYTSSGSIYATSSVTDSAKSQDRMASGAMNNSNSGASSVASTSATVNLFDQQQDDDETSNYGLSQESVIDMILTKRKLDRAENQIQYLKRTINIAEHYNKKNIPVKTVKKLLYSYGQELESGGFEEMASEVVAKGQSGSSENHKHSNCVIQ